MKRKQMMEELAGRIAAIRLDRTVRVAIDGVDASGKTMLADELVEPIQQLGRNVIRVGVDGFHRPRAERFRLGADSPEGFYHDTTDYPTVLREVLDPLGPGGNGRYRTATYDWQTETTVDSPQITAKPNSILLFDGIFLCCGLNFVTTGISASSFLPTSMSRWPEPEHETAIFLALVMPPKTVIENASSQDNDSISSKPSQNSSQM